MFRRIDFIPSIVRIIIISRNDLLSKPVCFKEYIYINIKQACFFCKLVFISRKVAEQQQRLKTSYFKCKIFLEKAANEKVWGICRKIVSGQNKISVKWAEKCVHFTRGGKGGRGEDRLSSSPRRDIKTSVNQPCMIPFLSAFFFFISFISFKWESKAPVSSNNTCSLLLLPPVKLIISQIQF